MPKPLPLGLLAALSLLSGCALDEEPADAAPPPPPALHKPVEEDYGALARRCIMRGAGADADLLDAMYTATLKGGSPGPLEYQRAASDVLHAKCMQKVAHAGSPSYISRIIVDPLESARVARDFYARGELTDGAYWLRRLVNLQGLANGYFTAGSVFIRDRRTLGIGARLLAEAAHQGSQNAVQLLTSLSSAAAKIPPGDRR